MLACVDGIAGVGKSTLLSRLENSANAMGIKTTRYHFFSDIGRYAPPYKDDTAAIEEAILRGNIDKETRAALFRKLCEIACTAFLTVHHEFDSDLTLFDRSPLSYYAYSEGALNVPGHLWPEFIKTVVILQPFILRYIVTETHQRTYLRDGGLGKGFLQQLSIEQDERVQESFLRLAHHFGTRSGDPDRALKSLLSDLRTEYNGTQHEDDLRRR